LRSVTNLKTMYLRTCSHLVTKFYLNAAYMILPLSRVLITLSFDELYGVGDRLKSVEHLFE
jgi:hypothetical protein